MTKAKDTPWNMTKDQETAMMKLVEEVNGCLYTGDRLDAIVQAVKVLRADPVLAAAVLAGSEIEVQPEWRVTGDPGHGFPPYSFTWPIPGQLDRGEEGARNFIKPILARGDWVDGPYLDRRTVIKSPWRRVETPDA